jgi:hypothetical protein
VKQTWDPGQGAVDLAGINASLLSMQGALKNWEQNTFGSVRKPVKNVRAVIEVERSSTVYRGPTAKERELVNQLSEILAREEAMERQRSRVSWLREGD